MLNKTIQKFKNEPCYGFLFMLATFCVLLFAFLFSLCILQSDDYSYATYLKDGFFNFLRLTKEHFLTINGRALVHFFLQITLSLPSFLAVLIKSSILFSIGYFSLKASQISSKDSPFYLIAFYSLLLLSGNSAIKEALMWTSGFFNYVFPAFFTFFALYLYSKGNQFQYLFAFLAGATTEQWGITAIVIIFAVILSSKGKHNKVKASSLFLILSSVLGYITIFLSPATLYRLKNSGHIPLSESLFDISRISFAFFKKGSLFTLIIIFILLSILFAYFKKGSFKALYSGAFVLFLMLTLPLHSSYMAVFIIFMCYLLLCAVLFFIKNYTIVSACLFGAFASIAVMLPTNTFDSRITFPSALLMVIAAVNLIFKFSPFKKQLLACATSLFLISAIAFSPHFAGFYKNRLVENKNLASIEKAQETKHLSYCIDYDQNYAVKQMFNDGWFFKSFLSLYDIEDCHVILESKNNVNLTSTKTKGYMYNDIIYLPIRELLAEKGGSITSDENGIIMTINSHSLTYLDGIFSYKNAQGQEVYLIADENRITDFYTLYIKLSVINDAFNLKIKEL